MAELFRFARRLRRTLAAEGQDRVQALQWAIARESDPSRRAALQRDLAAARRHVDAQRDLADKGR